jgi:hypothetical protein
MARLMIKAALPIFSMSNLKGTLDVPLPNTLKQLFLASKTRFVSPFKFFAGATSD